MRVQPGEQFLGAIRRGYRNEAATSRHVTPSSIWNHICNECIRTPNGFATMFAWDTRRGGSRNRIVTITKCIEAGLVSGLRLEKDAKGGTLVLEEEEE